MIINYRIYDQDYKIVLTKEIIQSVLVDLKSLNSDNKVLFVYDKNIDKEIIKNILTNLKTSGCLIFSLELLGNKIHKNEKTLFKIIDFLILNKFTKNSVMLTCSGGVIGDMASLAASLYMRGMIYLHIPTTITSIIDSCIGGKTGVNYRGLINSIGTYYHPKSVYISEKILKKIPSREYYSGLPEIIKYGLIKKNSILNSLSHNQNLIETRNFKFMSHLIRESLKTKIYYFSKDVYEKERRLILNFGHTFAHAIEMATQKCFNREVFRHGEAVGIGILCELYYANKGTSKIHTITENLLKKYSLPIKILENKHINCQKIHNEIFKFIFVDKKKIGKHPRYISLQKIGFPKVKLLNDYNLINETISKFLY
jgi:3-dehydroquinate synthase